MPDVETGIMSEPESKLRDELVAHLQRRPFKPFTVWMQDHSHHDIVRRFQAAIGLTRGRIVNDAMTSGTNFHIREIESIRPLG